MNCTLDLGGGTILKDPVNEKDIVNKEYVDSVATKSTVDLFLTKDSSDIATYFDLSINVDVTAEQTIIQSITGSGTTLIGSFASKLGEAEIDTIELLDSGIYDLHIHASGEIAGQLTIYAEFYKRASGGTETLLGTTHDSEILTTSGVAYDVHAAIATETAWVSGDRFVTKVYGRNSLAAAKNITINMEGDTASRVEFPAIIALGSFLLRDGSNADIPIKFDHIAENTSGHNIVFDDLAENFHAELLHVTEYISHDYPGGVIQHNATAFFPSNTGVFGTLDLGLSSAAQKWKDLYLSGDANVGGSINGSAILPIIAATEIIAQTPRLTVSGAGTIAHVIKAEGNISTARTVMQMARTGTDATSGGKGFDISMNIDKASDDFTLRQLSGGTIKNVFTANHSTQDMDVLQNFTAASVKADNAFTGSGAFSNFTISGGIVLAAS